MSEYRVVELVTKSMTMLFLVVPSKDKLLQEEQPAVAEVDSDGELDDANPDWRWGTDDCIL